MEAPLIHRFRNVYPNDTAFAFRGNGNVPVFTSPVDHANGFEIGAGSEIDVMRVRWKGGEGVIGVGAPLVGEFEGPFEFIPWANRGPVNLNYYSAGFAGIRADELAPLVEVVQHLSPPTICAAARGPATRSGRLQTVGTAYNNLQPLLVVPFYGRRRCTFRVVAAVVGAGGVTDLIFSVVGHDRITSPTSGTNYTFRDSIDYGLSKDPSATGDNGAFFVETIASIRDGGALAREVTYTAAVLATGPLGGQTSVQFDIESQSHDFLALYARSAATPTPWQVIAFAECSDA